MIHDLIVGQSINDVTRLGARKLSPLWTGWPSPWIATFAAAHYIWRHRENQLALMEHVSQTLLQAIPQIDPVATALILLSVDGLNNADCYRQVIASTSPFPAAERLAGPHRT